MDRIRLSERARGRWLGILPSLGIESKYLKKKNGPCPMCGGKDRWRFTDIEGKGTWWCNNCRGGGGVSLVMKFTGLPFKEAAARIEAVMGDYRPQKQQQIPDEGHRRNNANLWRQARPVRTNDTVDLWLSFRGVGMAEYPACLRYASLQHRGICYPAMLALVQAPDDLSMTVHRTFLTPDGRKASLDKPRMLAPGPFPKGGAIRLAASGPTLGVAEGIETALAAAKLFGVPTWSTTSAPFLTGFEPPPGVKRLVIFGDNDANGRGQAAAYSLAGRLAQRLTVEVHIPAKTDSDWNDVLGAEPAS
jgi:putative DNA primase/helicase